MWENLKWVRITPDRQGRGGTKSGFHTFQQSPINDTFSLLGAHVYRGYWRRDFDSTAYPVPQSWDAGTLQIGAIHGYVYPSLTDPAAQPSVTILGQTFPAVVGNPSHFWDFSNGAIRSSRPGTPLNLPVGAVFRNINQRCFGGDGLDEAVIMDDRTPAIHAQRNQNLGIGTPTQPLSSVIPGGVQPYGTGYLYNGSHYVTHPNPDNRLSTVLTTDTLSFSTLNVSYGQYAGVTIVQASPSSNGETSNTAPFTAAGTISITSGTSLVTLAGATWPANFAYCGLAINFNGYSFVIAEHGVQATAYDINGTATALSNVQLLILGVYTGPTISGIPYTITGCRVLMPGAASSLKVLNTGTLGYSQTTQSNLVQVQVLDLQASGYYRNLGNISLGPAASDSTSGGGAILTITDASMKDSKRSVQSVSNPFTAGDVGAPFFIDGAGATGNVLSSVVAEFIGVANVRLNDPNTSGFDVVAANAWWGSDPIVSDGVMNIGVATLTSASNPFVPGDVGQTIVVENAGPAGVPVVSLITTIAAYVGPGQVTLSAVAGSSVTGSRVWWRGVSVSTHAGPTYAYAWYDPETGHMSNISPLAQVPRPTAIGSFTDFANITPVFRIDPGYISYPSGVDATRFSHLVFFRTLSTPGSSTLYPIGSLMPFVGKVHPGSASTRGSWSPSTYKGWMGAPSNAGDAPPSVPANQNVWYDWSSDSDLLLSGGFRAPQFTNEKPMALLRGGIVQPGKPYAIEYWDRRTWIVNTQEPDKIVYSCDEAQCPLGVPEESFPPTNFLRLPAVDGRVIGMRTVGDMLLITTERWAYIVAGNNESNYRLMKISSSMPGVGTYQMDEFPQTGVEGEPITVFFLGRDRMVYQWTVGSQAVPISQPVQNLLDGFLSQGNASLQFYQLSRVHCVSAWGRRLVVIYPYQVANATFLIYDITNQVWSRNYPTDGTGFANFSGTMAMTTVYGLNIPVNEVLSFFSASANNVIVRSWLRDDTGASTATFDLSTFPMNFDGKKTRKQVVAVNLHATSGAYRLVTTVNESTNASNQYVSTFIPYTDPIDSIYGPAPIAPAEGSTLTDSVVLAGNFASDGKPVVGYRFTFDILRPDGQPANIYALDIAYVDYEDPGDGDA